jgi:HlyD family secretion protein
MISNAPEVFISGQRCGRLQWGVTCKCLSGGRFSREGAGHTLTEMDVAVKPRGLVEDMDRPLRLAWWRRPLWQRLAAGGGALLLVVLALVLLLGPAERTMRMRLAGVRIATVEQGVFHDFIPLRGEVVPHDTVYLDALEGGLVSRVLVRAGDVVVAGQPLVEFSNTELELQVQGSENGLVQSMASLRKMETDLELNRASNERLLADAEDKVTSLRRALERREELIQRHVISEEERDSYRDQLASAVRMRDMQREANQRQEALRVQQQPQIVQQLAMLQESLKITHDKLRNLTARAPVAGLVTAMDLTVGQNRNRGDRLAEIIPDTGFKLSGTVDEYYLGRLREGQRGSIERDGRRWPLTVTRVYPQVKDGGFKVDLDFDGATPEGLLRGQSLQGRLSLGEDEPGLVLESGAFLEASGGDWVFVLDTDGGTAHRRRIKLGRRNAEQVEVLAGLAADERVMVSDYTGLDRIDRIEFKQ